MSMVTTNLFRLVTQENTLGMPLAYFEFEKLPIGGCCMPDDRHEVTFQRVSGRGFENIFLVDQSAHSTSNG